MKLCSS